MMEKIGYTKSTPVTLKDIPQHDELWLKKTIIDDPSILGLGDLIVKDVERMQPKAGRIDLLLHDDENDIRYEVEIMLGKLDESHIIRAIEYWDIERKRSPNYEHRAVMIAENITSRFLNIVQLFNNTIPLIAIQLNAVKVNEQLILNFTKILDIVSSVEEEDIVPKADRKYWEDRASTESLKLTDECLNIIKEFDPECTLSYNKYYIGLSKHGHPTNFVVFRPKRAFVRVEPKLDDLDSYRKILEEKNIEVVSVDNAGSRIKFRLTKSDIENNRETLKKVLDAAQKEWYS
jgi:hypothetical protein